MISGTQTIQTDRPVRIRINGGNLVVKGDERLTEAQLISHLGERQADGAYHVGGNAVLRLPSRSSVMVEGHVGQGVFSHLEALTIEALTGSMVATHIGSLGVEGILQGNAALKHIKEGITLETIYGNVAAKHLHSFSAGAIHGNAALSHLEGELQIDHVMGNLALDRMGPSAEVTQVDGRLALRGPLHDGGSYRFATSGEARVQVSGNVRFVVRSSGVVRYGEGVEGHQDDGGAWELFLGDPEQAALLEIESEGDVEINLPKSHPWTPVDFGPEFEETMQELRRAMGDIKRSVRESMAQHRESDWSEYESEFDDWSYVGQNIGRTVRAAVNDFLEALRPQPAGSASRGRPASSAPPPSSEELTKILQMVENGEITAEEAEQLIDAMG